DLAVPGLDTEELVTILVDFFADILARLKGHQHQLQVLARIQNTSKFFVLLGQILDIIYITFHGRTLSKKSFHVPYFISYRSTKPLIKIGALLPTPFDIKGLRP